MLRPLKLRHSATLLPRSVSVLRLETTVFPLKVPISSKKSSITAQSLWPFQYTETSSYTKTDSTKSIPRTKDSPQSMQSRSLDGTSWMVKIVGLLRIVGVSSGAAMVQRTFNQIQMHVSWIRGAAHREVHTRGGPKQWRAVRRGWGGSSGRRGVRAIGNGRIIDWAVMSFTL